MASVKIILRTNKINSKGEAPLCLQIIHERKIKEISLKRYIEPKFWNKSKREIRRTHPNSTPINVFLNNEVRAYEGIINSKIASQEKFNLNDIVDIKKGKKELIEKSFLDKTLTSQIEEFINNPPGEINSINSLTAYKSCLFHLRNFDSEILVKQVSKEWLDKFLKYLNKKGNSTNTSADKVKVLKSVLNRLVKNEKIPKNPLKGYKRKTEPSKREFLTKEELILLQNHTPNTEAKFFIKDIFLFGCYTGLRFSDICTLEPNDVRNDGNNILRLYFQMNKTRDNLNIKLSDRAKKIYYKYKTRDQKFVFPILDTKKDLSIDGKLKKEISRRNAYFNKILKEIITKLDFNKKISFHCSRHTFATLSLTLKIPIEVVSKLLGHKNIQETQIYAKILDEQKDAAIDIWDNLN